MDYDRIIIEMLNRIQILEDKVAVFEKDISGGTVNSSKETDVALASSKKYRQLSDYLYSNEDDKVRLTFGDIEQVLGFTLPPSAYIHRAFWANTKTHSIALSWMSVGFETVEVNIEGSYVIFEKKRNYEIGKRVVNEIIQKFGNKRLSELTNTKSKEGEI